MKKLSRISDKNRAFLTVIVGLALLLSSCSSTRIHEESEKIGDDGWPAYSAKGFEVDINDTLTFYNIAIYLRNTTDYHYRNLYLFVTTKLPNGALTRDTVDCILASHNGFWTGDGIGSKRSQYIPFRQQILFPFKGRYTFYIEQAMREDTLQGISDVGIRIDRVLIED